jgi:uncharacterized repeat protein (TIGR01451 family)
MKTKRFIVLVLVVLLVSTALVGALAAAGLTGAGTQGQEMDEFLAVVSEEMGMEASYTAVRDSCAFDGKYELYLCRPEVSAVLPKRDPAQARRALELLGTSGLVIAPDSTFDRVMAFDPTTGDVVDPNFIPPDPAHLITPKEAILSASGNSILVSDQVADVVYEYDLLGNYVGIFAPAGGPNPAVLDNILGIALRPNGNLLVTVGSGTNLNAVAEFDTSGSYLGNFITAGSGGLAAPFDIYGRAGDWLVGGNTSAIIHRYDAATGAYIADLASIDEFPQQIAEASNDNVLAANFFGTQEGIVEFTSVGVLVDVYHPADGYRGVYELPNGNFLSTTSDGVYEISRAGAIVDTKYGGIGGQYLTFLSLSIPLIDGTKSAANTLLVGDTLTYTIAVQNWGTDATGVVMTDVLPAGTTYVPSSISCQGATGSCIFDSPNNQIAWNGDMDSGEALTVTYALNTDAVDCGVPISNQAIFSTASMPFDTVLSHSAYPGTAVTFYDFEANDGGFFANTPPGEWAWGALVPSPNAPPAAISGSNLWATNLSGNITIEPSVHYLTKTLNLAAGTSYVSWWDWWDTEGVDVGSVSIDGTELYSVTIEQNEWKYHILDLTPWQNQTVGLTFFYDAVGTGVGAAGWYVDDVEVLGCESLAADFSNSTKDGPTTADSGSQFMYTIEIVNSSANNAVDTSMVDPIPAGLIYVNGTVTGGAVYNAGMNQIEWDGDVGPNSTVTVTFMVEVTADSGMVTNIATIDHSSITPVQVSAATTIIEDYEVYLPVVLKP